LFQSATNFGFIESKLQTSVFKRLFYDQKTTSSFLIKITSKTVNHFSYRRSCFINSRTGSRIRFHLGQTIGHSKSLASCLKYSHTYGTKKKVKKIADNP